MPILGLLHKYFADNPEGLEAVVTHSRMVADKALAIAAGSKLSGLDLVFIEEAALLHDIGICRIHAPALNCHGKAPYICHGIAGREILEAEGLFRHALVCERHIGVGLTARDIAVQRLPLPAREMSPVTAEERLVALADLFFSKRRGELTREKGLEEVRDSLRRFSEEKVAILESWLAEFSP